MQGSLTGDCVLSTVWPCLMLRIYSAGMQQTGRSCTDRHVGMPVCCRNDPHKIILQHTLICMTFKLISVIIRMSTAVPEIRVWRTVIVRFGTAPANPHHFPLTSKAVAYNANIPLPYMSEIAFQPCSSRLQMLIQYLTPEVELKFTS